MESIFRRHIGAAWDLLPDVVRRSHEVPLRAGGTVDVRWGPGRAGRLLARALRMPPEGSGLPITMDMRPDGDRVLLVRTIGTEKFPSSQAIVGDVVREWAGPATFDFRLEADAERLVYRTVRVRILGVPAPGVAVTTVVEPRGDGWRARVTVETRLLGRILEYDAHVDLR
jgi:hypothetical protein